MWGMKLFLLMLGGWWGFAANQTVSLTKFKKICEDEMHVSCVTQGQFLLQKKNLPKNDKIYVYMRMSVAYLATGKQGLARSSMESLIKLAPCLQKLPTPHKRMQLFFKRVRKSALQDDFNNPLITHIAPSSLSFLKKRKLSVKVSDDYQVRDVTLFYRFGKKGVFLEKPFTTNKKEVRSAKFEVIVPTFDKAKVKAFQYYIRARDCTERKGAFKGSAGSPFSLQLISEVKESNLKWGSTLMLGAGVVVFLGGTLAFYNASNELTRWENTNDLKEADEIRDSIILYHALGWTGVVLGLAGIGAGTYFLLIKPILDKPSKKETKPTEDSSEIPGTIKTFQFHAR